MRQYLCFLLLLAVLLVPGCTGTDPADTDTDNVTAAPPLTLPPVVTTAGPAEMGSLEKVACTIDQTSETSYHCNGKIRIKSGTYEDVRVIARFADNNVFESAPVALGGSNPVLKSFAVYPDFKYRDQIPTFTLKMDGKLYPVVMDGDKGLAYSNAPPAPPMTTPPPTTTKKVTTRVTTVVYANE